MERLINLSVLIILTEITIMNKDPVLTGSSKVTSKGQITIPQDIRNKYKITPGDMVYFLEEDGKLILRKGPLRL